MTGDMINTTKSNANTELMFKSLADIAPVFCVDGYTESSSDELADYSQNLYDKYSIIQLDNSPYRYYKDNSYILLYGLSYTNLSNNDDIDEYLSSNLYVADDNIFSILLSYRPDYFKNVQNYDYSVMLCGSTHGGKIILPFIGGIVGTDGKLFPKYDFGFYDDKTTSMIISRGLGNDSSIPRVFNRPDIVSLTLHHKD